MLKLYPFYSSSSGNMYLIESKNTNIIVDVGVSYQKCKQALESVNKSFDDVSAIFITHEHTDHIKGLPITIDKENIPVYSSKATSNYLSKIFNNSKIDKYDINSVNSGQVIKILDIEIIPFDISHDALQPFGYRICSESSTITIATDLGEMTENVMNNLQVADFAVIESNYDKSRLLAGKYPFLLKKRIDSTQGHLSNIDTASAITELAKQGKRNFLLAHLSENNNLPILAHETLNSSLKIAGFDILDFNINLATKEFSNEVYTV